MPKKTSAKDIRGDKNKLHPRSRKAVQLHRTTLRTGKLNTQRTKRICTQIYPLLDRISWFQLVLDPESPIPDMHELVEQFLSRYDEEVSKLEGEKRLGRPLPKRLDELQMVKSAERREYEGAGFQIPDLSSQENVQKLRAWDGTRESLHSIRLTRIRAQPNKE